MAKMTPPRSAQIPNVQKNGVMKKFVRGVPLGGWVAGVGRRAACRVATSHTLHLHRHPILSCHPCTVPSAYAVPPILLFEHAVVHGSLASATCGQQHSVSAYDLHCHLHLRPDGFQCSEDEVRVCSRQLHGGLQPP